MRPQVIRYDDGSLRRSKLDARGTRCSCGKHAYSSRKLAASTAAAARRHIREPIHAYHCQEGHCWHIGHPPGTQAWRRQQAS